MKALPKAGSSRSKPATAFGRLQKTIQAFVRSIIMIKILQLYEYCCCSVLVQYCLDRYRLLVWMCDAGMYHIAVRALLPTVRCRANALIAWGRRRAAAYSRVCRTYSYDMMMPFKRRAHLQYRCGLMCIVRLPNRRGQANCSTAAVSKYLCEYLL